MTSKKLQISKDLVGKTVWGQRVAGWVGQRGELTEFTIIAVGRRYATLRYCSGKEEKYCLKTGCSEKSIRSGYTSSGYRFYLTKEDYLTEVEHSNLRSSLGSCLRSLQVRTLPIEIVKEITDVLEKAGVLES